MVAWKQLSDTDLAAVITYTRNSWGNKTARWCSRPMSRRRGHDGAPVTATMGATLTHPSPNSTKVQEHAMSSASHDSRPTTATTHDDHAHHPTGIMRWLTTTNHKDIGTMYLWFSFTMFLVGGMMALMIRAELFQPGLQIVNPEFFNQLTTLHGLIMVFGAIMPAAVGLRQLA